MNYKQTKNKAFMYKVIGSFLFLVCLSLIVTSVLKGLYVHFDSAPIFRGLSKLIKSTVNDIYASSAYFRFLWGYAPKLNMMNPLVISNLFFVSIYFPLFVGAALIREGRNLSKRLKKIDRKIEDQLIEDSLTGKSSRSELESKATVSSPSFWQSQFHTLYVAPVFVALIVYVIQRLLG